MECAFLFVSKKNCKIKKYNTYVENTINEMTSEVNITSDGYEGSENVYDIFSSKSRNSIKGMENVSTISLTHNISFK